jgi:hypothetical protein
MPTIATVFALLSPGRKEQINAAVTKHSAIELMFSTMIQHIYVKVQSCLVLREAFSLYGWLL